MRLRLLWIFASVMLMFFVFSPPVFATATQCGIHKNSEWRCAKDNFGSDSIRIANLINRDVSFKVGRWSSTCGKKGAEFSRQSLSVKPSSVIVTNLPEAVANQCIELFVFDCSPDSCTKTLAVSPIQ
jgi:hypothetical protein